MVRTGAGGRRHWIISTSLSGFKKHPNGTWTVTGSLANARFAPHGDLLPDGKVLVAGGVAAGRGSLKSAELYDPASGTWTATGRLNTARDLSHGDLAAQRQCARRSWFNLQAPPARQSASADLYDSASGTWIPTRTLNTARYGHRATLLPHGEVLVAGGGGSGGSLASAELYLSDGELTLVSAASRKTHGNAGPFDIDLPLTGTPGVECRQGNAGPFLQMIVFSFSEDVISPGAAMTDCGTVLSSTIDGSTVTVNLGNVKCDGSDITVTVPGVTGC